MSKQGKISSIMGAVVDIEFNDGKLPEIYNAVEINPGITVCLYRAKKRSVSLLTRVKKCLFSNSALRIFTIAASICRSWIGQSFSNFKN